jgi:uroporphyrinogen-III synthase
MHILVTRPETEAPRTKRKLEAMGHSVTIAPLLKIVTIAPPLDTSNVQALVLTSRNAVHSLRGHRDLETLRRLPVISVGKSTAEAARDAGFTVELEGDAGGAELAALIIGHYAPKDGYLLHISGEAIAYDLDAALAPHGFTIRRAIVYRSEPIDHLPHEVASSLRARNIDAVLLMSPRTSEAWCRLVETAGLTSQAKTLLHLCLSEGVASALQPLDPARIDIAVKPNEEQMLALVAGLSSSSADRTT